MYIPSPFRKIAMLHLLPVDILAIECVAIVANLAKLVLMLEQAHRNQRMRAEYEADYQKHQANREAKAALARQRSGGANGPSLRQS
jgi:hypothetical protein